MIRVQYLLEYYSGEKFLELSKDLERSSESKEHGDWNLFLVSDNMVPVIEDHEINARNGLLNFKLRQSIRSLARKLRATADSLSIKPRSALLSVERAVLLNEGLNHDEVQVVNNIHLEKTPTTVSKIAEHLEKYTTSRTFLAALRYLSYCSNSPLEELALSCELVRVTYPTIRQLSCTDSLFNIINQFIADRLDGVLH